MENNEYELHTLPNGIRIVHKQVPYTKIVHCGFVLDIGSRDEKPDQHGIAHFWEHMAFKGTQKRKAFHILNRLDAVGGELNAYTTKEKICFYASLLDTHFNSALELLADITFDSVFPEKQIERERNVILEEMSMYYDAPDEALSDEFDGVVFENHPLGRNILGTRDSIGTFHRANFKQFILEHLDTSRLIFSCVGNLPMKKVIKQAEKYLLNIPQLSIDESRLPFQGYRPQQVEQQRNLTQSQCAIGRDAFPLHDERRLAFLMLTNILGGPAMNSRLNLTLREKYGLVYNIEADYSAYTDTGLFGIYFGTDPRQLQKSIGYVLKELKMLQEKPLGSIQLHRAKEQLMGQIAMGSENNQARMLIMGKSLLEERELESLDTIYQKINHITASELQGLAQEMFDESQLSILSFVPKK